MNPNLYAEAMPRLMADFAFKEVGDSLRQGKCPNCGKKELYTLREKPWILRCGRLNKCGAELRLKEIYPDLFDSWSRRHPPTRENPNAAADAYLRDGRGFDLAKIKGWYTQEQFWDHKTNQGSATVRFILSKDSFWERLIDNTDRFERKFNFRGGYTGTWWQAPDQNEADEIWITEGILKAIALMHHGINAVATMSCVNYPAHALAALAEQCAAVKKPRPRLIWALDNDNAGLEELRKHLPKAKKSGWDCKVALLPQPKDGRKYDWNDAHQDKKLEPAHLDEALYLGNIFLAKTPLGKAILIAQRKGWRSFPLDFDKRIFWANVDPAKEQNALKDKLADHAGDGETIIPEAMRQNALKAALEVHQICNCLLTPLYFQRNEITRESWHFFKIEYPEGKVAKDTFKAGHLTSSSEFKTRLLDIDSGGVWRGNAKQLDALLENWTTNLKTVETQDFIGYSKKHKAWIFEKVAVKGGKIFTVNDDKYFDIGNLSVKSLLEFNGEEAFDINTDLKSIDKDWFDRFYLSFSVRGIIALAYWLGALFAEQIRARHQSFPFLEIVGESNTGKSTMLKILWKLLGREDYEGFDC